MCIIASVPRGRALNEEQIDKMWNRNSHGGGIAWIEDGKVKVYKSLKLKPIKEMILEIQKQEPSDILVHMRIKTNGRVCLENCHPFHIDTQTVFAHNGIMPREFHPPAKLEDDISDTRWFGQIVLEHIKLTALDDSRFIEVLEDMIGRYNKLVILTANPKLHHESYIINESSGEWHDGIWFSNDSYKPFSQKMTFGTRAYVDGGSSNLSDGANCSVNFGTDDAWRITEVDKIACEQYELVPPEAWDKMYVDPIDRTIEEVLQNMQMEFGWDSPDELLVNMEIMVQKAPPSKHSAKKYSKAEDEYHLVCIGCKTPIDMEDNYERLCDPKECDMAAAYLDTDWYIEDDGTDPRRHEDEEPEIKDPADIEIEHQEALMEEQKLFDLDKEGK